MAQATQIVPTFSFPHVETVINDYTLVEDDAVETSEGNDVTQAYAVVSSKGIDNTWVRKNTKSEAIKSFGDSDFKKYGQPLMQALHALEQDNASVWMMRVMPENAAYSNGVVSVYYKADAKGDVVNVCDRKFRIKLTSKSEQNITTAKELANAVANASYSEKDSEGFEQRELMSVKYCGRGTCGDYYSMRMSQAYSYEKEYGIKMYNFEVLTSENGLVKDANYIGALVSSTKYGSESTTLIDDVLGDAEVGVPPIDIVTNEDSVEDIYNAYVKFITEWNADLVEDYETKLDSYKIPEDQMNGTSPVSPENAEHYAELKKISALIDETNVDNIPDVDEFDIIFGLKVASTTDALPGVVYIKELTDDVNQEAADYDEKMYSKATKNFVDFSSVKGLRLSNGTNGYFDSPRTINNPEGGSVQWTYDQEVEDALTKAYDGTYDPRILSSRRIPVTAFFDANYPYAVKSTIVDIAKVRNDCRVYLDTGIIESLSSSQMKALINDYSIFDDYMVSTDIHNYQVKEYSTNKKCRVTITYFLAYQYVEHITERGIHIPFVKEACQLSGHIRDSLAPVVEEYNLDTKEILYNNRFNYFECMSENVFRRSVQNTTQKAETDLLEESNATVLYTLKRNIERDIQSQIYNFADETIRKDFVAVETAAYSTWVGEIVESLDISFSTSEYEFNHSILHMYLSVVFRGLTKKCIVEIDINKRTYTSSTNNSDDTTTEITE